VNNNPLDNDLIGRKLGPYEIVELIGAGGTAEVYRAYQSDMDREVAIKIVGRGRQSDEVFNRRFRREAKAIARLRHPNIVQMFDFGLAQGGHYMVMEYVEGGYTLANLLREAKRGERYLNPDDITFLIRQIGAALDHAHENGVIHRDVKPGNVLLTRTGQAILTDFGLALLESQHAEDQSTGVAFGTAEYMAPEQIADSRSAGPESDLYSLGVILYEMLTSELPFDVGSPVDIALQRLSESVPDPRMLDESIPKSVAAVTMKALAKAPRDRFHSGMLMAAALERAYKAQHDDSFIRAMAEETMPVGIVTISSDDTQPHAEEDVEGVVIQRGPTSAESRKEKKRLEAEVERLRKADKQAQRQQKRAERKEKRRKFFGKYTQVMVTLLVVVIALGCGTLILTSTGVIELEFREPELLAVYQTDVARTPTATLTAVPTDTPTPTATATATALSPVEVTPVTPVAFTTLDVGTSAYRLIDGETMMFVPAGQFLMGTNDQRRNLTEQPQHPVSVAEYWIDRTEVTNRQYRICVDAGACEAPTQSIYYDDLFFANYPVFYVKHAQAASYCLWLARESGLVVGLPTEAQWEKAAGWDPLTEQQRRFPWGETYPTPAEMRFIESNAPGPAAPVGTHPAGASAYGVQDMGGNAWEWVADWYDPQYYRRTGISVDPTGPASGTYRVSRGGAWTRGGDLAVTTIRNPIAPETSSNEVGFRCAMTVRRPPIESSIFMSPLDVTEGLASYARRDAREDEANEEVVLNEVLASLGNVEKSLQAGQNDAALPFIGQLIDKVTAEQEAGNLSEEFALKFGNGLLWMQQRLTPEEVQTPEPSPTPTSQ